MLRKLSLVVAAAAFLAIPLSQADARHGHGMRMGHVHHSGIHRGAFFAPRFRHHHRRFFVGAGFYSYGYTCWRWVPTRFGWRRVWVCGYPYY